MSTKDRIASILEQDPGKVISGAALARELKISRTAVWKHMQVLMEEGYPVKAVPNKGYVLEETTDRLSEALIRNRLKCPSFSRIVHVHKSLDSTNETGKMLARDGEAHGTLVVADEQVQGKGRRGKTFFSPSGKGIYMSILLRPDIVPEEALHLTIQAAVAVTDVLEELFPADERSAIQIKWVNDVYIHERKVAGILTEAAMEMESGKMDYVVVGIGVNVVGEISDLPESIRSTAGFLSEHLRKVPSRNELIAAIANRLEELITNEEFTRTIQRYAAKSYLTGKTVQLMQNGGIRRGIVAGIDEKGRLVMNYEDGSRGVVHSGEVELLKDGKVNK
ncbi:biotin--[acetyl-CoA-carboxylase] ligase [Alkalibacter rhizosphaerae]|uniref:Bifunctional ligase/repressor BirA n=1 Tax=Alkalibacter rhizosphaerae TaxID=2815577 RepID=A0A974XDP2_9FIRM|nr:biotin--[acetyl-CoA-carboxylase] ligase [Alkalibacter rhizosphaerae]QSX07918.1 biotin--[acetyl-CoA-carboxylase] ligase [Alkalibacter rhizosphaerae]